ncbi:MAG: lipocalin family protein [Desulfuromonadaceae bacterium]
MKKLLLLFLSILTGCVGIPNDITAVNNFNIEKYLGKWYEIARLDHSFERGLSHVTAEYSRRKDGGIRVINRGYSADTGSWKEAEGKAYFVGEPDQGFLKVAFFGPFYGSYIVFELDQEGYQYALVCGPNRSYLWILARTPTLPPATQNNLVKKAFAAGFDTNQLLFVDHGELPQKAASSVSPP